MNVINLVKWMSSSPAVVHLLLAAFSVIFIVSTSSPIREDAEAMLFLEKYGYLGESTGYRSGAAAIISQETVSEALLEFQRFAGINQTGELDNATLTMMNAPRCGVKDKIGHSTSIRRKRYALQGSKWGKTSLTYKVSKYPTRLKDRLRTEKEIARAFKVWSDVTSLTFQEKKRGRVNIDIRFEEGDHGDGDPFDGPGKTLAHAFFPQFGGDAHFDDEEKWTISERYGTNLFQVAAHEFGHSLGLAHSDNQKALMAPYYRKYEPSFELHSDDVRAMQALYGSSDDPVTEESEEEESGPPPDVSDAPDLCQDATIDAVTRTQNGSTYVFKGAFYWKILTDGIASGYPRRIEDDWDGLEGNLDAALTWSNGKTFFFKGGRYWRFTNKVMDYGYPKLSSVGFEGVPDRPDAAFVWSGNGKTYFFKGDEYWRYDSNSEPPVSNKYPKPISSWKGLPNYIDAAFQWENQRMYFFKGDQYYRFNDLAFEVDSGDPPYPRSTSVWWFDCRSISHQTVSPDSSEDYTNFTISLNYTEYANFTES